MTPRPRLAPPLLLSLALLASIQGCGDTTTVEPLAPPAPVLAGTVTDLEGRPAEGAVVAVEPLVDLNGAPAAAGVAARLGGDPAVADKGAIRSAVSDAHGRYAFAGLEPGAYLITTALRDHAGDSRDLQYAAAAGTTFVDIQLTPTGTFIGLATLENETLHDGTVVYVVGTSYLAVTDLDGSYAMTGVPAGSWDVRAFHAGWLDDATSGAIAAAGDTVALADLFLPLDANLPPAIDLIEVTPGAVDQPTAFAVQASDPDGTVVRWEWDFDNDGVWDSDSPTTGDTSHVYTSVGPVTAKLRVTDDAGATALDIVSFEVPLVAFEGIFVSPTGDDAATGAHDDPLLTITAAIGLASQQGLSDVWIETGTYVETVTVSDGIGLHGGRLPPLWERDPGQYSVVTGAVQPFGALVVDTPTLVEGLQIVALDAVDPGQASVAATLFGCTSDLTFDDCRFVAGNGAGGADGINGANGDPGDNGQAGSAGACDDEITAWGGSGGGFPLPGGDGGRGGRGNENGLPGQPGTGASGGSGGAWGDPGQTGANGQDGPDGGDAPQGGHSATPDGFLSITLWVANQSAKGMDGGFGEGGGGGGGGGGQSGTFVNDGTGNGGGGGGAGGVGGNGGDGGHGGGASICVILVSSSPTFVDCVFVMGNGGRGGDGGDGGFGGPGGQGGPGGAFCLGEVGRGGDGGNGGDGGDGAGGAGGPGGPCFGIYGPGASFSNTNPVFQAGTPGAGGLGGAGAGATPGGADGVAGYVQNLFI